VAVHTIVDQRQRGGENKKKYRCPEQDSKAMQAGVPGLVYWVGSGNEEDLKYF
jgi:hypothetical protein